MLLQLVFAYTPAYADPPDYRTSGVQEQIAQYLCTPPASTGEPGNPNGVNLYQCINKLYKFAIIFASVVGVFFIVIAGYIYMGSEGNQESVEKAKSILISTVTSLVILLSAYVLLKAINPDLIQFHDITLPAVTSGTTDGPAIGSGPTGDICKSNVTNKCSNSACNKYDSQIAAAAQKISIPGVNKPALIKAVMTNESSCDPAAVSGSSPPSIGLMQLKVQTAQNNQSGCTTDTINDVWLKNPDNSAAIICIGAKYLEAISKTACGKSILNIAAGYNGGTTRSDGLKAACDQSADCSSDKSCDGTVPMKAWECTFADVNHTKEDPAFKETRNYAPQVYGCYQFYDILNPAK